MRNNPVEIVRHLLESPACKTTLSTTVSNDAVLVTPDSVPPPAELLTDDPAGPEHQLVDTAVALFHGSATRRVSVVSMFGADGNVAAFGTITEVGNSGEDVTSPFSLWVKVRNGRITYMQYLDGGLIGSATASRDWQC